MGDRLLTSLKNPRVKQVLSLRRRRGRAEIGQFVAEGRREIGRAVDAGVELLGLYWCGEMGQGIHGWVEQMGGELCWEVSRGVMEKMAYRQKPEGVVGVFRVPVWGLGDIGQVEDSELWLVGVGIEKPGNLGAMARCASAAGCRGLLVADGEVDVFNPNCIRASTGAVFGLPVVCEAGDAVRGFLEGRGVRLVVAMPEGKRCYSEVDLTGGVAVVVGAEDRGVPVSWGKGLGKDGCTVQIPMSEGVVDSLNTSVAAAVLLYEAVRQRGR